jgi:hypothetical protein
MAKLKLVVLGSNRTSSQVTSGFRQPPESARERPGRQSSEYPRQLSLMSFSLDTFRFLSFFLIFHCEKMETTIAKPQV